MVNSFPISGTGSPVGGHITQKNSFSVCDKFLCCLVKCEPTNGKRLGLGGSLVGSKNLTGDKTADIIRKCAGIENIRICKAGTLGSRGMIRKNDLISRRLSYFTN